MLSWTEKMKWIINLLLGLSTHLKIKCSTTKGLSHHGNIKVVLIYELMDLLMQYIKHDISDLNC